MQVLLSVGEKYSVDLWKLGDDNAAVTGTANPDEAGRFQSLSVQDLEALSQETRDIWSKGSKHEVLRAFRSAWVASLQAGLCMCQLLLLLLLLLLRRLPILTR